MGCAMPSTHEPIDRNHHRGEPPTNKKGFRNEPFEILASQEPGRRGGFGRAGASGLRWWRRRQQPAGLQQPEQRKRPSTRHLTSVVNPSDKKGGTLKFANAGDWDTLDPGETYYGYAWNFARLYGRSLMMFKSAPGKEGNQLVPDLAEAPGQASDGAKTWTYKLRKGVKFDDGTEVTSADVKYAVLRSTDKQTFPNGPAYWDRTPEPAERLQGSVQNAEHEHRLGD